MLGVIRLACDDVFTFVLLRWTAFKKGNAPDKKSKGVWWKSNKSLVWFRNS